VSLSQSRRAHELMRPVEQRLEKFAWVDAAAATIGDEQLHDRLEEIVLACRFRFSASRQGLHAGQTSEHNLPQNIGISVTSAILR
jgi:hypothetical protein